MTTQKYLCAEGRRLLILLALACPAQGSLNAQQEDQDWGQTPLPASDWRFNNDNNPAIGVSIDGFLVLAEDNRPTPADNYNSLSLRTVELDLAGRIDPFGWGYVIAEFGNDGEEESFELIEAALWADQLPNNFSLRGGRYLADFGKWNATHQHQRATSLIEGARLEFLGGSLRMDGLELHHWFGMGDVPLRWSVGVGSAFEGHGHPILPAAGGDLVPPPGGLESGGDGRRGLSRAAFTGRLTAQHEIQGDGYFQWGLSAFHTSGGRSQELEEAGVARNFAVGQSTYVVDLTWRQADGSKRTADVVGVEVLWNDREQVESFAEGVFSASGAGLWGFWEHSFSPQWACALHASWWEHADKRDGGEFFSGSEAGSMFSAYATWSLSELQRLRAGLTLYDPQPGTDPDLVFTLQWNGIFGSHVHGLDW